MPEGPTNTRQLDRNVVMVSAIIVTTPHANATLTLTDGCTAPSVSAKADWVMTTEARASGHPLPGRQQNTYLWQAIQVGQEGRPALQPRHVPPDSRAVDFELPGQPGPRATRLECAGIKQADPESPLGHHTAAHLVVAPPATSPARRLLIRHPLGPSRLLHTYRRQ